MSSVALGHRDNMIRANEAWVGLIQYMRRVFWGWGSLGEKGEPQLPFSAGR